MKFDTIYKPKGILRALHMFGDVSNLLIHMINDSEWTAVLRKKFLKGATTFLEFLVDMQVCFRLLGFSFSLNNTYSTLDKIRAEKLIWLEEGKNRISLF